MAYQTDIMIFDPDQKYSIIEQVEKLRFIHLNFERYALLTVIEGITNLSRAKQYIYELYPELLTNDNLSRLFERIIEQYIENAMNKK